MGKSVHAINYANVNNFMSATKTSLISPDQ